MSKGRKVLRDEDYGERENKNRAIKNPHAIGAVHFVGDELPVHCEAALRVPNPQKAVPPG